MMEKKDKTIEFLSYIKTPLSDDSIAVLYSANNIRYEKCLLFSDYVQSLLTLIFDTYLGDDFTSDEEKINHFKWCWDKNIKNFIEEDIWFYSSRESFDYFSEFMREVFYELPDKEGKKNPQVTIRSLWVSVFSYNNSKSRSDMDNFVEIYNILDKSLKNGKKSCLRVD
jgi:hypothetical protein